MFTGILGHLAGYDEARSSPEWIGRFFEGMDLVEPGLVSVSQRRPDPTTVGTVAPTGSYGAVAREP